MNTEHVSGKIDEKEVRDAANDKWLENLNKEKIAELIKNNVIEFEHNRALYRVRMLNMHDKEELDLLRRKKYGQLLQDKDILTEKKLIEIYKEQDIVDINELDRKIESLNNEITALQLKLGDVINQKADESVAYKYAEEIIVLQKEKDILIMTRSTYLEFSKENTLLNYVAGLISYMSLDINKDGDWVRAYNSLDEFGKETDEQLVKTATSYALALQYLI
jgi:hypothetical protein